MKCLLRCHETATGPIPWWTALRGPVPAESVRSSRWHSRARVVSLWPFGSNRSLGWGAQS